MVKEDCKKLGANKTVEFHNLVAKMLYATKHARLDTCTSIAFLTTRVCEPDKDDWAKLCHLMKYVRGMHNMPLILSANGSSILKWWVDASFAVHLNMRGHSREDCHLVVEDFPSRLLPNRKLNSCSSTETEFVGADNFMLAICGTQYFMEAQGYEVNDNILYQDNKSAMLLEKNGKASSTKRTKHINIQCFFITNHIANGDLSITWYLTLEWSETT